MNKVSSKLAAGVRRVKAEQKSAPAASKQVAPRQARPRATDRAEKPVARTEESRREAALHPARIWPD